MTWLDDGDVRLYHGDALGALASLPAGCAQTCVTSPPYWGLRDYGTADWTGGDPACEHSIGRLMGNANKGAVRTVLDGDLSACQCGARRVDAQLGLEATPDAYVAALVAVMAQVWRVLRDDGTLWLNLGDSYGAANNRNSGERQVGAPPDSDRDATLKFNQGTYRSIPGLKAKDLVGIPWRVAFALQAAGWYLRSDIIWAKPNPMPESVTDRPTKAHEYLFLLAKSQRYYYDAAAIREPAEFYGPNGANGSRPGTPHAGQMTKRSGNKNRKPNPAAALGNSDTAHGIPWEGFDRNKRTIWEVPTRPQPEAHFATFPEALVRPCILAGSAAGGVVLDPFMGSGTTAVVARKHGRRAIGVELNEEYLEIASRRLGQQSLLSPTAAAVAGPETEVS